MVYFLRISLFFLALLPVYAAADELFIETGAAAGRFIGLKENYLEAECFYVGDWACNWAPLMDAHAYFLENSTWAGSAGIGFRAQGCGCDRLWGMNLFYDFRELEFRDYCNCEPQKRERHFFHRAGIGFESLGTCVDYRANVYIPIGNQEISGKKESFNNIGNGYYASFRKKEYLYAGVDAEVGFRTPSWCDLSLYGAVGGYYYHHDDLKDLIGPMARLDIQYGSWLTLEGRYSYDQVNNSSAQGRLMLTIPLDALWNCCTEACSCFNPFIQPLQRNGLIFTERTCCWNYNW
jgi:hypothetical protein